MPGVCPVLLLSGALELLSACGEQSADELLAAAQVAAAASDSVNAEAATATESYERFLESFPQDSRGDDVLRDLGRLYRQQGEMETAIDYYRRLLREHPDSDYGAEAQFMVAFIYEEHLGDLDQARAGYARVIEDFPGTELALSAERLLPHVGKNPEEWVPFEDDHQAAAANPGSTE